MKSQFVTFVLPHGDLVSHPLNPGKYFWHGSLPPGGILWVRGADPNASSESAGLRSKKQCACGQSMLEAEPCSLTLTPEPPLPLSASVSATTVAHTRRNS